MARRKRYRTEFKKQALTRAVDWQVDLTPIRVTSY